MHFKDYIAGLPAYKPPRLTAGQLPDLVKLSSNENALGPSPKAVDAMQRMLHRVHSYPDSSGVALRAALAARVGLSPDQVVLSNGSDELILLLSLAFLREGDAVVMAEGTFISYLLRTRAAGATPVRVPLRADYTHDLPAMLAAITPETRLVYICNPNNPTGTTSGAEEMQAFLAQVPDDVLVVVDEAYIEYATRPDFPNLLPELQTGRKNLLLMRTFAKIHGLAGLRLGYAFAHATVIDYLHRARPVFNVNTLAQVAGLAALDDSEHVQRTRDYADAARTLFITRMQAMGVQPVASETNFVAVPVGDDAAVAEALMQRGYAVTPLSGWGVPGCIRVSFGTPPQNEGFLAALEAVLAEQPVLS